MKPRNQLDETLLEITMLRANKYRPKLTEEVIWASYSQVPFTLKDGTQIKPGDVLLSSFENGLRVVNAEEFERRYELVSSEPEVCVCRCCHS